MTATTTPLPVDRGWIAKLLEKHGQHRHADPVLRNKALVVAPMVDQSDLPYRLLCRRYGANLAFTPMIHTGLFATSPKYREKFMVRALAQDRPLIAQLCGSNLETCLETSKILEPHVDGIDINCGCPQGIARRGNYGAFLLEQEENLLKLVKHLAENLKVPLSVKVRLLPAPAPDNIENDGGNVDKVAHQRKSIRDASMALYEKLIDAGIHLLTIHGRTRLEKGPMTPQADWEIIGKVVQKFGHRIPIFANGSIGNVQDVKRCLQETGVDGIMSSEAILEYPPVFQLEDVASRTVGRIQLAQEYLELARQYPPNKGGQGSGLKCIRIHLHRFLHADMQADFNVRDKAVMAKSVDDLQAAVDYIQKLHETADHDVSKERLSWYMRHRGTDDNKKRKLCDPASDDEEEEDEDEGECMNVLFDTGGCDDGDY